MCVLKSVDSNDLQKIRCFVFFFLKNRSDTGQDLWCSFQTPSEFIPFFLVYFLTMCDYKGVSWAKVMKTDVNLHLEFEQNL